MMHNKIAGGNIGHQESRVSSHTRTESNGTHAAAKLMTMTSSSSSLSSSLSSSQRSSGMCSIPGQYDHYQSMYNSPKRPQGIVQHLWSKIEMFFIYMWVLIQTLFLIAGLTVLHFSTFSTIVVYLIVGVTKGRREFLPQY